MTFQRRESQDRKYEQPLEAERRKQILPYNLQKKCIPTNTLVEPFKMHTGLLTYRIIL